MTSILAMKLAFRPGMTVEEVEDKTNEIEHAIRAELPRMRRIFIEVDSRGDGRGVTPLREAAGEGGGAE